MLCRMPPLSLPGDLIKELQNSESGTIDGTQGPGVATYEYLSPQGGARADIYIGFEMDGFKLYQNISAVMSNPVIKMQFVMPIILCQSGVLTYKPKKDSTLTIQVVAVGYWSTFYTAMSLLFKETLGIPY